MTGGQGPDAAIFDESYWADVQETADKMAATTRNNGTRMGGLDTGMHGASGSFPPIGAGETPPVSMETTLNLTEVAQHTQSGRTEAA